MGRKIARTGTAPFFGRGAERGNGKKKKGAEREGVVSLSNVNLLQL